MGHDLMVRTLSGGRFAVTAGGRHVVTFEEQDATAITVKGARRSDMLVTAAGLEPEIAEDEVFPVAWCGQQTAAVPASIGLRPCPHAASGLATHRPLAGRLWRISSCAAIARGPTKAAMRHNNPRERPPTRWAASREWASDAVKDLTALPGHRAG
jgi:hypothetical protein